MNSSIGRLSQHPSPTRQTKRVSVFLSRSRVRCVNLLLIILWLANLLPGAAVAESFPRSQPNILFIFLDDLGWKDVGYMGSDFYETPNLDRLACGGMIFSDAYSCAANCAPARACLMSGQYTPRHKIYNVGTKPRGNIKHRRLAHIAGVDTLDPHIRTWAQQLQLAGYRTATMGKWHLSDDPRPYGFDVNIGGSHAGGPPNGYYSPHGKVPNLQNAPPNEYVTDRLSDEACQFIRDNRTRPWMLYLTHFAVHTPLDAKRDWVEKYRAKPPGKLHQHVAMATMIQAVDDGIGKIVATLDELELTDQTVIVFTSDNGGYGPATDMDPLKGYKGTYYEGGIRVPFFVNWPGVVAANATSNVPILGVDLFPTFCEIGGTEPLNDQTLDGVSLVTLFRGNVSNLDSASGPRSLFWHFPAYLESYAQVTDEQQDRLFRSRPCSIIRRGKWKLHQYFETNKIELYDLKTDIGETKNVAAQFPNLTQSLLTELQNWQRTTKAAIPNTLNPQFDAAAEASALSDQ